MKNTGIFIYPPKGQRYANIVDPIDDAGWTRIEQATDGQNLPWTFFTRILCDREVSVQLKWNTPTNLKITGPIKCRIELKRDLESALGRSSDPYDDANSAKSPYGLGWFLAGSGSVVVNDSPAVKLNPNRKQLNFPRNWSGVWVIDLEVSDGGTVNLNQGERRTEQDDWKLPQ